MDTQIWYAIFSTIFGGIYGAFRRLGEVSKSLISSYCSGHRSLHMWASVLNPRLAALIPY